MVEAHRAESELLPGIKAASQSGVSIQQQEPQNEHIQSGPSFMPKSDETNQLYALKPRVEPHTSAQIHTKHTQLKKKINFRENMKLLLL